MYNHSKLNRVQAIFSGRGINWAFSANHRRRWWIFMSISTWFTGARVRINYLIILLEFSYCTTIALWYLFHKSGTILCLKNTYTSNRDQSNISYFVFSIAYYVQCTWNNNCVTRVWKWAELTHKQSHQPNFLLNWLKSWLNKLKKTCIIM